MVRIYGPDLHALRKKANEVNKILGGIDGLVDNHVDFQVDVPADPGAGRPRQGRPVRPQARRRAARGVDDDRRRGGRRHLPGRQGVRRRGVEHAGDPQQRREHRQPPARHADRAAGADGRRRGRQGPADPEPDRAARATRDGSTSRPTSRGATSGRRRTRCRRRSAASGTPAATTPSCSGSTPSARPLSAGCSTPPASRRWLILLLLQTSFGSWRLALLSFLTLPMALVGGVLAAYLAGGDHLARRAGRLLHGVRHRRPQRDPADQPLPAPGTRGGRDVRPGAGPPRRAGAALADPDDLAGDRPGTRAARGPRRPSGSRDRVPAGHRHPGRVWSPRRC